MSVPVHPSASQRFSSFVEAERLARARRNRLKMPELKDLRQQLTSKAVEQGHLLLGHEVIARVGLELLHMFIGLCLRGPLNTCQYLPGHG